MAGGDVEGVMMSPAAVVNHGGGEEGLNRSNGGAGVVGVGVVGGTSVAVPATSGTSSQRTGGSIRDVKAMAQRVAAQPLPIVRPDLWGLLTAVSDKARKRPQGFHIMLHSQEHVLGRTVKEASCQFESPNVSGRHCTIFRRLLGPNGKTVPFNHILNPTDRVVACVRDSSSNGTFINYQKLQRSGDEVQLRHGDVISLVGVPEHENAFAFVYREVSEPVTGAVSLAPIQPGEVAGQPHKRKGSPPDDAGEAVGGEGKRIRGIGNGGVAGPVLLNDVRQLQRSNQELREQLETHMLSIEKMRSEYRSAETRHATELKEVRAALSQKSLAEQEELRQSLLTKEKELEACGALCSQQESTIEVLKQRLASAAQSRIDAEEVIVSLKVRVEELEKLTDEERIKNNKERAEAETSMKAALDRVRIEAAEEMKRHDEAAARQQEQQNDIILALQEGEKEFRSAAEISRKKLDLERAAVVAAEERIRWLESQLQEERNLTTSAQNKAAESESKLQQACRELEVEKVARESALLKVADSELKMEAAIGDLKLEKQRLQGARERIVLRETQLRAFHTTAAEIAELQQRQQDQLSMMIRTLEDGDSDNDHHDANVHSTSPSTKAHPGPFEFSNKEKNNQSEDRRRASQSAFGSRPMQVDTDSQSLQRLPSERFMSKDTKVQDDERSKDTAIDDSTEGDTQQDDCSSVPAALGLLEATAPPTQLLILINSDGSLSDKQSPSSANVQAGYTQLITVEAGFTQVATPEAEFTQLENADNGFTQLANADCGYTQLLTNEVALQGPTAVVKSEEEDVNQGCAVAQDRIVTSEENEAELIRVDEEAEEPQPLLETSTEDLLKSRGRWNDCSGEECRASGGRRESDAGVRETISESRKGPRDSLCTADLLTSEVAGSWAVSTPASAIGQNDYSSGERGFGKDENRMISDEGVEYAASQVATNNITGGKHAEESAAGHEGRNLNDIYVNVDLDIDMSQTTPKNNSSAGEPHRSQEHQALNEMLSIVAPGFGNFHEAGRRNDLACTDNSSSDTSSTEDGSREEGEIGASELRDSEPVSPSMYNQ